MRDEMMFKRSNNHRLTRGSYLPAILMVVSIMIVFATALLTLLMANMKRVRHYDNQVSITSIAEAGINYYLWHLAHNPDDYQDLNNVGVSQCLDDNFVSDGYYGPCHHDYTNTTGNVIGSYDLYIYPSDNNTSTVQLKSVGQISGSSQQKTIAAQLAIPSFANSFVHALNDEIYVDVSEVINGPVFVNSPSKGLRNYGIINGVTKTTCAAGSTFRTQWGNLLPYCPGGNCPCVGGPGQFNGQIINSISPFDPADINYTELRSEAVNNGQVYTNFRYHIILHQDSYELRRVTNYWSNHNRVDFGTIRAESNINNNVAYPANGLIFFDDDLWIEGTLQNRSLTVVSNKNIYINNSITYFDRNDPNTKLGLVANLDIPIVMTCPNNLTIDAAMLAKNGVTYYNYPGYPGSPNQYGPLKTSLNVFGAVIHKGGLEYQWTQNGVVRWGFANVSYNYSSNLLYSPPPYFPKSGQYQIINWHEE